MMITTNKEELTNRLLIEIGYLNYFKDKNIKFQINNNDDTKYNISIGVIYEDKTYVFKIMKNNKDIGFYFQIYCNDSSFDFKKSFYSIDDIFEYDFNFVLNLFI